MCVTSDWGFATRGQRAALACGMVAAAFGRALSLPTLRSAAAIRHQPGSSEAARLDWVVTLSSVPDVILERA